MGRALITDLYELNMAASFLRRGIVGPATFSLFIRRLPPDRGFLVAAGLDDCLSYLESFRFDDEDLEWLASAGFPQRHVDALAGLRFTGDVHAVPEGTVVLADEPILEVTAPTPEAQIVESYLLNQVTFQTTLATKAARCRLAAGPMTLVDFSLRRTQGTEAAMAVARLSAIAGFSGTSNVEAARRFGLQPSGTMAHSYVEAFPSEEEAFEAYAEDLPGPVTFLVDTYDTLGGVRAAAGVIRKLGLDGPLAVRLDSGDLVRLSRETRHLLDEAGLPNVKIFASGGLDEYALEDLRAARAPVDAAGIGTRMGVSADAPYLDSAYKLVSVDGRPVTKLSAAKETLPGAKQVWRRLPTADVLALRNESGPPGSRPLLVPVMRGGRRVARREPLATMRARLEDGLADLPADARRLRRPVPPPVTRSERLSALASTVAEHARREAVHGQIESGSSGSAGAIARAHRAGEA